MLLAFDTETTGKDFFHGAKPFFVTTCDDQGDQIHWEWDVNPLNRQPIIPPEDLGQITGLLDACDEVILHNAKFDVQALAAVLPDYEWPWEKTQDTLLLSHLLASNRPHDLTSLVIQYLGRNIEKYEKRLQEVVQNCRRLARSQLTDWRIAKEGLDEMPSAKEKTWKYDTWLPRAFCRLAPRLVLDQDWESVLSTYSNYDSASTMPLWLEMRQEAERRGLWEIYLERRKVLRIAYDMERRGVSFSMSRLEELKTRYTEETAAAGNRCVAIAASVGHELTLPKSGNNKSLMTCCFDALRLPVIEYTEKGNPSLNKGTLEAYSVTLPAHSKQLLFVKSLINKRKKDTQLAYMEGYRKFGLPLTNGRLPKNVWLPAGPGAVDPKTGAGWYVLHPSLNPTGTDTLRWSCSNPNEQNISKQEVECRRCDGEGCEECRGTGKSLRSLRYVFGPAPGREWWSFDAKNIELRIPAYEAKEEEMIALFEQPDKPPYYGSNHLLNFSTVYPDIWAAELNSVGFEKVGPQCKKKYASTFYQWCKNGGFKLQYGGLNADSTFHREGATAILRHRFAKLEKLNQWCIRFANDHGYIETLPDRTVNPNRGYPLLCTRTDSGAILPTVPLNYRVQSTAMWWTMKAMIRVEAKLREWYEEDGFDGFIAMQVHDELVLDFPKGVTPEANNWRAFEVRRLMEQGGEDIGIPTPVGCEYHAENWAEGVSVAA